MRPSLILLVLASAGPAPAVAAPGPSDAPVLRSALVLPRVGRYGRAPVHVDPVQASIVAGAWAAPAAGDGVEGADGTTAAWAQADAADDGWLAHGALRGGYVSWSVEAPEERIAILDASGHSMVYVNGEPRAGDPYGNGWVRLPVALRAGRNDFLFHVSRGRVRADLETPPAAAYFETREPTLPDLVVGEDWPVQGAVVVVNATREPLDDLVIRAGGSGLPLRETPVPRVPPLTLRKAPFWFGGALPPGTREAEIDLRLVRRRDGDGRELHATTLRTGVRRPDERHRRTFVSAIDGSVQYYAIVPMAPPAPAPAPGAPGGAAAPALFLTLHGASVEGAGQAAVYRPKDWGHVVAPTNRRPFGFDWEDWGRLDALEVLELNQRRLGIDPARTYLTGHSMGGHGTWHLGVTYPDRFAAIGPSAGWRSFRSYGGAERFEDATGVERLLARATSPSDTVALARNTLHHGVYVLHGEKDDNVPVEQARFMVELLRGFHPDVEYHEEPGAGHWWGNRCCDWDPMFAFFRARTRPAPDERDAIEFRTASPGVSAWSAWIGIEQQDVPLEVSTVTARRDRAARTVTIATDNVARLALAPAALPGDAPLAVEIDGDALAGLAWSADGTPLAFVRSGAAGWTPADGPLPPGEKGPHRSGPFKDAFRHRVMLVHGTTGTPEENAWARAKARFDAETFWYRGNAAVDVRPDTDFDPGAEPDRSVVLYGNADTNAAWAALLGASPVQAHRGEITLGERRWPGDDLGLLLVRPRPGSDVASVAAVAGSGVRGMRLTDRLPYFVSGVAYPDSVVLGPETLAEGVAGVRAAGSFGSDWSITGGQFEDRAGGHAP